MSRPDWQPTLVGRDAELELLRRMYQRTEKGEPCLISIVGPAGIGKTALVHAFCAGQQTLTLSAGGDESESTLRFGLIGQLLRQLPMSIPEDIRALTSGQSVEFDPFMVGAIMLDLLLGLQRDRAVLVIVEDVHCADADSQQALAFIIRRLPSTCSVLLLVTFKEEGSGHIAASMRRLLGEERATRIVLGGLSFDACLELARGGGTCLSVAAIRRLHEHTDGNPLHLRALLQELDSDELDGQGAQVLPAPRSYAEIVGSRLRRCRPTGRRLVEAAAVLGIRCRLEQATRIAGLKGPLLAVDDAVAAGLCRCREAPLGTELEFDHPLTRAAVYHSLGLERRSQLHRGAAAVVNDKRAALRHEAAASQGSRPDLARRLKAVARDHLLRNDCAAAAADLLLATRLSATRHEREECALDAIDSYLLAGDAETAGGLTGELEKCSPGARRDYVLARLRFLAGHHKEAQALFRRAWSQLAPAEDELAVRIAGWYALTLLNSGHPGDAIAWAERVLTARASALMPASAAMLVLLDAHACRGDLKAVMSLTTNLPGNRLDVQPEQLELLLGRASARLWSDRIEDAAQDLATAVDLARARGVAYLLVVALAQLADAEYRLGRWDDAIAHGELSASMALAADMQPISGPPHAIASFTQSARGCWDRAERLVRFAEDVAKFSGEDLASMSYAAAARARLELLRGQPAAAARALEATVHDGREPLTEPGIQPWHLLYAEALYELGNLDALAPVLDRAEARVRERGHSSLLIVVRRLQGQLRARMGSVSSAKTVFEAGLAEGDSRLAPFEYARLQLTYGAFLRRQGRRRAAKAHLESARDQLHLLGAAPVLERCEQELTGTGLRPNRRTVDQRNVLTSRELTVARLVAEGMSNREVAERLVVSTKTIEYHLNNVFAKLGLRSRGQLVRHVLEQQSPAPGRNPGGYPGAKRDIERGG